MIEGCGQDDCRHVLIDNDDRSNNDNDDDDHEEDGVADGGRKGSILMSLWQKLDIFAFRPYRVQKGNHFQDPSRTNNGVFGRRYSVR